MKEKLFDEMTDTDGNPLPIANTDYSTLSDEALMERFNAISCMYAEMFDRHNNFEDFKNGVIKCIIGMSAELLKRNIYVDVGFVDCGIREKMLCQYTFGRRLSGGKK